MLLLPITLTHPDFPFVSELYITSFPSNERRELSEWQSMCTATDGTFTCLGIYDAEQILGFISIWKFCNFSYVEHFALHPEQRGSGWGSQTIPAVRTYVRNLPIVLEVEPPTDETTRRRVRFYERAGLTLSNRPYLQPPYRPTDNPLPLRLMTTDADFLSEHFEEIVLTIHREVYGVRNRR